MDQRLINIGFGNSIVAGRVIAVVRPKSAPMTGRYSNPERHTHSLPQLHKSLKKVRYG